MKEIVCMAAVLFAAFTIISCSSPEDRAESFVKDINKKETDYLNGLSAEEKKEYTKALNKALKNLSEEEKAALQKADQHLKGF